MDKIIHTNNCIYNIALIYIHHKLKIFKPSHHLFLSTQTLALLSLLEP